MTTNEDATAGVNAAQRVAGALLGLSMLLLVHRYWGIDHDATLYLGEALHQLQPDTYGKDLYFAFGSQGEYTLFPWLLARLMEWIAPVPLFMWGGLAGLLAFAWASWFCLSSLLPAGQRYWAWLGVLCLPAFYGRTIIFGYAEPFMTPRPFAEALALLAVGLAGRGRVAGALACVVLAGLLHPLQAIAASLVLWPWAVLQDRRWLRMLWLLPLIAAAALAGVPPFDGLLRQMDPAWEAELRGITGQLFLTGWPQLDYQYMAFDALLLCYVWKNRGGAFGRLCMAALAGLGLGTGASLLLVDGLQLSLPTGLQLWRVHWLAHWVAMAGFAACLHRDIAGGERTRALALALAGVLAWGSIAWAWLPFAALYAAWPRLGKILQPRVVRLLALLFGLSLSLLLLQHAALEWITFQLSGGRLDQFAIDRRLLAFPLLALGLPLMLSHTWNRCVPGRHAMLGALLLLPLVVLAAMRWDIRTPHRQAVEARAGTPVLFGAALPADAQVYWHDMGLAGTWLVLQRADYYDPQQLSGMAFNRTTIFEARQRLSRIGSLIDALDSCQSRWLQGARQGACKIDDEALRRICAPGPSMRPDALIVPVALRLPADGIWKVRDSRHSARIATYRLYGCDGIVRHLRDDAAHASSNRLPPATD